MDHSHHVGYDNHCVPRGYGIVTSNPVRG